MTGAACLYTPKTPSPVPFWEIKPAITVNSDIGIVGQTGQVLVVQGAPIEGMTFKVEQR